MTTVIIPNPDWVPGEDYIFVDTYASEAYDPGRPHWKQMIYSDGDYGFYWLRDDVHKSIKGSYTMNWDDPSGHWVFEFEDRSDALLFKLVWGGK